MKKKLIMALTLTLTTLLALSLVLTIVFIKNARTKEAVIDDLTPKTKVTVDPVTGYSIIETEEYTALVPPGGRVVCEGSGEPAAEMKEITKYPRDEYIVDFDREETQRLMYEHVITNNPELSSEAAMTIAIQLTDNIEKAREASLFGNETGGTTVICLGQIVDGKLVEVPND